MSTLRQLLITDPSKPYYLSAAPQCPRPDTSILVPELLDVIDFFGVQFYNNAACQLNAGQGFLESLQAWSDDLLGGNDPSKRSRAGMRRDSLNGRVPRQRRLRSKRSTGSSFTNINNGFTAPRLLIGTPAFGGAGSGYVDVSAYKAILEQVQALALPNLAGAIFWDGAYEEVSGQVIDASGVDTTFAQVVRQVLA
jgi:chitinase